MNRTINLHDYKETQEELKKDLLEKRAGVTIVHKGKTKKLIIVTKGMYHWLIFDGTTNNPYVEIEYALGIDLNKGLDDSKISIAEFTI